MKSRMAQAAVAAFALLVASVPLSAASAQTGAADVARRPLVQIAKGPILGIEHAGVDVFTAVPYAAPPIGALRFKPPQPHAAWTKPLDASRESPACPQTPGSAIGKPSVDEDCLFLNVWAPTERAGGKRPVLVWIHGSGTKGYGDSPFFDGFHLAHDNGVVVVTINYRLGLLGSLVSPSLNEPGAPYKSGDYWLLDQQQALHWVQHNIERFGGNPHDVTVMGESAGGASVLALLASPLSKGLFQRAIVESEGDGEPVMHPAAKGVAAGYEFTWRSAPQLLPRASAEKFVQDVVLPSVGCASVKDPAACLRGAPVSAFLKTDMYIRVQDNGLLPLDPFAAFRTGAFVRVPVLIGSNAHEGYFMAAGLERQLQRRLTQADYRTDVETDNVLPANAALKLYPVRSFPSPAAADSQLVTDLDLACPAELARREMSAFVPVFGYEFTEPDPVQEEPLPSITELPNAAYHTSEEAYVFDGGHAHKPLVGRAAALSTLMRDYWTGFARTGNPNGDDRPNWPAYSQGKPSLLNLQDDPAATLDFAAEHGCAKLEAAGLLGAVPPRDFH